MINLGVVFGSKSTEHEVSILTAYQAIHALNKQNYQVYPIYVTKENDFYLMDEKVKVEDFKNINQVIKLSKKIQFTKHGFKIKKQFIKLESCLLCLHGSYGEDGMISALLDIYDISYIGSDHISSAVSIDKVFLKQILKANNIPVLPFDYLYDYEFLQGKKSTISFPCIVKPAKQGSSIGICVAKTEEELNEALKTAFQYDKKVIIEQYISAFRELNCAVRGDYEHVESSMIEEVFKGADLLSFQDKYQTKGIGENKRIINVNLPEETKNQISELAKKTFQVLGCSGIARVDLMLYQNEIYINEINSIPGSLSFYLWKENASDILDDLIKKAFFIRQQNLNKIYSYHSNILNIHNGIKK